MGIWFVSAVLLAVAHVTTADYAAAIGPSSYGRQQPSYRLRNAGRSHQFSWIGSGRHIPRRIPRPPQLPRFIWMGRPMYNAVWVPKIPSNSGGGYGRPRPSGHSSHGGVSVLGGDSNGHSSSSHSSGGHEGGGSQGYQAPSSASVESEYGAPKGAISGGPVETYSSPQTQNTYSAPQENTYEEPQVEESYSVPQVEESYGAPQVEESYSAPQVEEGYSAPQVQESYSAPQVQESYSAPQAQESYNAPQVQESYSAPQVEESYSAPQVEESYSTPQTEGGFSAIQVEESYAAPQVEGGFSAIQVEEGYAAPQVQESYSSPQVEESYSAPQVEESYSTSQTGGSYNAPEPQNNYNVPQVQESYTAPEIQQILSEPQVQESYSAPQSVQTYSAPQSQETYNAPQVEQSYSQPQQSQQQYSEAVQPNNVFTPLSPDPSYGSPHADSIVGSFLQSQTEYNSVEQPQQAYSSPVGAQANNDYRAASQSDSGFGPATSYQSGGFDSVQTSSSLGTDYGAPKDNSLIDFSSAQRYETAEIVPQTSPVSSTAAVDPSSYGQPKANSILAQGTAQSLEPTSYQASDVDLAAISQDSIDLGYGSPKSASLVDGQQEYASSSQQYNTVPPPGADLAQSYDSDSKAGIGDYSAPSVGSIISLDSAQVSSVGYIPEQSLPSDNQNYDVQRSEDTSVGYTDISPESIITLETLQSQNGDLPSDDNVYVDIRGSFNYNRDQQQPTADQGYGAPQSSDVVTGQYSQDDEPTVPTGYGAPSGQSVLQQGYYDLQYPQASQYQEEFYRPNQLGEDESGDFVEVIQLTEEPFAVDENQLDKAEDDDLFVYYTENDENDLSNGDGGNDEILTPTDALENVLIDRPSQYFGESGNNLPLPTGDELDQQIYEEFEDKTPTTEASVSTTEEFVTTTTTAATTYESTTESTEAPTTKKSSLSSRHRRPFFNLPTRRPYFSSFYQRRRSSRRSTTTTENTPQAEIQEGVQLENDVTEQSKQDSPVVEEEESESTSQEQAIQSRLEEIRQRRKRPIPFGARLRPKSQRSSFENNTE